MPGTLHIVPCSKALHFHRIISLDVPPTLFEIERAVGGPIKLIAGFDSFIRQGELEPCFVFCNEHAELRELPPNTWANLLWLQALVRTHGFAEAGSPKVIRGPIALLWGDAPFFEALKYNKSETPNVPTHNSIQ